MRRLLFVLILVSLTLFSSISSAQMGGCALYYGNYASCMDSNDAAYEACLAKNQDDHVHCSNNCGGVEQCLTACYNSKVSADMRCEQDYRYRSCLCYQSWCDPWRSCSTGWD